MPNRSNDKSVRNEPAIIPAPAAIPSTPLVGNRRQLRIASVMLAIWVALLAAMAFYS
jgi:hypothetical protein